MSNELFKIKYNGSFSFIPEEKLTKEIRKAHTWFTNKKTGGFFTALFFIIDFFGFFELAANTVNADDFTIGVLIGAFLVAFEIAPLYYGYALCLKCYNMGKQIHKHVLRFSGAAFLLGIIGNAIYRILTFDFVYNESTYDRIAVTIVMIILPIITSLMSLVIGCLIFDPLLFEMNSVSKKINRLNIAKRRLTSAIAEYGDLNCEATLPYIANQQDIYDCQSSVLEAKRDELYEYISYKVAVSKKY